MDSGWAVVLGAVIALTGSAVIPWIREARTAGKVGRERATERVNDAIVELLAVNARMAVAVITTVGSTIGDVYAERQRAATRLLLAADPADREGISQLLGDALPSPGEDGKPRQDILFTTHALQGTLVEWASGDLAAAETKKRYREIQKIAE